MGQGSETKRSDHKDAHPVIPYPPGGWERLIIGDERSRLEALLPDYLRPRRWFGGKTRQIRAAHIQDAMPIGEGDGAGFIALAHVTYTEGRDEIYTLPLAHATGVRAEKLARDTPHAIVARLAHGDGSRGALYDAVSEPAFCATLLQAVAGQRHVNGERGALVASTTSAFSDLHGNTELEPKIVGVEQSNSSVTFGDRLILKLFRRPDTGINPDLEIGRFLTEQRDFAHIPPVAGAIEYQPHDGEARTLAIVQGFVSNQGDAWAYTLRSLEDFYKRAEQQQEAPPEETPLSTSILLGLAKQGPPPVLEELAGSYLQSARLLGRRTAEMHLAPGSDTQDAEFAPEPLSEADRRAIRGSIEELTERVLATARATAEQAPESIQADVLSLVERQGKITGRVQAALERPVETVRIRCHGDYHLGQVLYTGDDFFIIDFEGEPARPLSERRQKRSPLQDVAGMLRSFDYAAYSALPSGSNEGRRDALELWARGWRAAVSGAFLGAYLAHVRAEGARLLPPTEDEIGALLDVYLLEKAVYELGYELNNRPDWIRIPLQGIRQLLDTTG